jgi:hypothetical protein
LHHLGQSDERAFEGGDVRVGVSEEPDADQDTQPAADGRGIDQCPVTADHAGLLEFAHAPQARRGREPDLGGEFGVADPAVLFEYGQDGPIHFIHTRNLIAQPSAIPATQWLLGSNLLPKLPGWAPIGVLFSGRATMLGVEPQK